MIIFICSRLRGDFEKNLEFAEMMAGAVIRSGNVPLCPHQIARYLDDKNLEERELGMLTAKRMIGLADEVHVFAGKDGVSEGMAGEIMEAIKLRKNIKFIDRDEVWNTIHTRSNLATEAQKRLESIKSAISHSR